MIVPARLVAVVACLFLMGSADSADLGLVARYSFEEGGGNVARDSSGTHNDAKINEGICRWKCNCAR